MSSFTGFLFKLMNFINFSYLLTLSAKIFVEVLQEVCFGIISSQLTMFEHLINVQRKLFLLFYRHSINFTSAKLFKFENMIIKMLFCQNMPRKLVFCMPRALQQKHLHSQFPSCKLQSSDRFANFKHPSCVTRPICLSPCSLNAIVANEKFTTSKSHTPNNAYMHSPHQI
jgi:hypothetical protein